MAKRKWVIVIMLNIFILVVGGFYIRHVNNYRGVTCMDCFRMTNYLHDTGHSLWPEESHDNFYTSETVEELAYEFMDAHPWLCERCAYSQAKEFLYPEIYLFPLISTTPTPMNSSL